MKKIICKIISITMGIFAIATPLLTYSPVFAACPEGCVETTIVGGSVTGTNGEKCSCGSEGISEVLKLAVRIFTIAVGVLAAIGITITGIQYLTAGSNEEQTRKAKRRLFEIILGIVAFVLIYSILSWLLPGFSPTEIWG